MTKHNNYHFTKENAGFFARRAGEARRVKANYARLNPPPKPKVDYSGVTLARLKAHMDLISAQLTDQLERKTRTINPQTIDRLATTQGKLLEQYMILTNPPKNGNGAASHFSSPDDVTPVEQ